MPNKLSFLKQRSQGLNLVEVVIAVVIFTFIAISLMSIFAQGYRNLRRTRMRQTAYLLAQEKIEELSDGKYVFSNLCCLNGTENLTGSFSDYRRQVIVQNPPPGFAGVPAAVLNNLTQVNVTVSWNGTQGQQQNFTLSTLIANQH